MFLLQYDLSASQFSPDGRVFQVEYAQKAVENSGTSVGLRCKDGIVFGVEKIITSKLYEPTSNRRIFTIDSHIGLACAGLLADARAIVEIARIEASNFRSEYSVPIPIKFLAERVSLYLHAYTLYSAVRPYGCAVMIGGVDESGPQLYVSDPSGLCHGYFGSATGKAKQNAKTEIEKLKLADMTCKELVKEAAKIIYLVHDEVKDKHFQLELSWVCKESEWKHVAVPKALFEEADKFAKAALQEDSSDEDEEM
ncbi:UNVERIFIED_CONTAM: hypothetical protein GTU68_024245 [Idotea baltica]|nr:hypothetical protein [Idotea baltica]